MAQMPAQRLMMVPRHVTIPKTVISIVSLQLSQRWSGMHSEQHLRDKI